MPHKYLLFSTFSISNINVPYTKDPYFGISTPAYVKAPNRARPSAGGTMLPTHFNRSSRKFPWLLVNSKYLCWTDYKFKVANNIFIIVVTLGNDKNYMLIYCKPKSSVNQHSAACLRYIINNDFTVLGHQQLDYKVRHIFFQIVIKDFKDNHALQIRHHLENYHMQDFLVFK